MSCLGRHYALTETDRAALLAFADDDERIDFLLEDLEERFDEDKDHYVDTDKAWDAIHRCLGDFPPNTPYFYPVDPKYGGYALPEDHGSYPLKLAVLGGRRLNDDESRFFIRLIEPNEVADLAEALKPITRDWMRERYFRNCAGAWPEFGEEDFEYTWAHFEELRDFFLRIAPTGRSVIFTADQ